MAKLRGVIRAKKRNRDESADDGPSKSEKRSVGKIARSFPDQNNRRMMKPEGRGKRARNGWPL